MTKSELLLCAECAEGYPPGMGFSYFSDERVKTKIYAFARIAEDPDCIKFG